MSRKKKVRSIIWSRTRLCVCCGKAIVLLRLPGWGSKTDMKWYRACYVKGWDYNPWYTKGCAVPHPRPMYVKRMFPRKEKVEEDPFFSLD